MASLPWTRLPAHTHDAWSLAIPLDRAFVLPVWCQRFYCTHPSGIVQYCHYLHRLVLAALPGENGCINRRIPHGRFAVHALLWKICTRGCVHWFIWVVDALRNPSLYGNRFKQISLFTVRCVDHS